MSDEDDIDFFVLKDLFYEVNEINKNEANAADKSLTEEEERKHCWKSLSFFYTYSPRNRAPNNGNYSLRKSRRVFSLFFV